MSSVDVPAEVALGALPFERGGHVLVSRALAQGSSARVRGSAPDLEVALHAWCRGEGHALEHAARDGDEGVFLVRAGAPSRARAATALSSGDPRAPRDDADPAWGIAARGARVEAGGPTFPFPFTRRSEIWSGDAARLYAQGAAAQWDPARAIPWDAPSANAPAVEDAIVQIMTYLVENETAALVVPTSFLVRIHPHFREVLQVLAVQAADEARHIDVFTRRALLRADPSTALALSTVGGQTSLRTLFDEPDFTVSAFLLSVLGEGTFLSLLHFLRDRAPDPVTREVARLAAQDEARHVAFGIAHVAEHVAAEPTLTARLANAVERRHAALASTAGLNASVFDALVVYAAGSLEPDAIGRGFDAVVELQREMNDARAQRLARLGFTPGEAEALAALHTRSFM